jgi:hypothetical protein
LWDEAKAIIIGRFCLLCDGRSDGWTHPVHLLGGFMAGIASPCVSPSYMPCQAYALAGVQVICFISSPYGLVWRRGPHFMWYLALEGLSCAVHTPAIVT